MTMIKKLTPAQREELRKLYMKGNVHFVCLEKDNNVVKAYSDSCRLMDVYEAGSTLYEVLHNNYPADEVVCLQTILSQ